MSGRAVGRQKWRKVGGRWTCSLGHYGARVRLFENQGGVFYRDVWFGGKKDRRSLGTRDKSEAERLGKALLAELLIDKRASVPERLELGDLWERFSHQSQDFLDNTEVTKDGDAWSAMVLIAFFGAGFDVSKFTPNDQTAFTNARLKGGILLPDGRVTNRVRARTVQSDLNLLHQMLRWASRTYVGNGERLLAVNPLDGVRIIREVNDVRPVTSYERFLATRTALAERLGAETDDRMKMRLTKLDLALVFAEAAGRRLNSIRHLRWEDVDFEKQQVRWRAEFDKKRKESVVPLPPDVMGEIRQARVRLGVISGWVFAAEKNPGVPMDRHLFDHWLVEAEKWANLPKLKGGLWHPYRRKWATERKEYPLKDVMAGGGWSDANTLLKCYQQADRKTLLRVMSEPQKLSEVV